jgi:hypothetical protein
MILRAHALVVLLLIGIFAFDPTAVNAQQWVVDVGAGQTLHQAVPGNVEALGAVIGLRRESLRWAYPSAGLPLDSNGLPWAAAGGGGRFQPSASAALAIDGGVHFYGFTDAGASRNGGGATLELLPLVQLTRDAARLEVRTGLLHHASTFDGESQGRSVHHSDARLILSRGAARMMGEGRFARAEEGDYPFLGASVEFALGTGAIWGSTGRWFSSLMEQPEWGFGGRVRVASRAELYAVVQQSTNDPLYWNVPRRSWSVGVTRALGRSARPESTALLPIVEGGRTTFLLPVSDSPEAPMLGGDFNGWQPVPMQRDGEFWSVSLPVIPGIHRFAFRSNNGQWFVPENFPGRIDDGFGGVSATILVR